MAGTTVYLAKVNLKALLETYAWDAPVPKVRWGAPSEGEKQAFDLIYFGDTEMSDEHRVLGRHRADENYRLRVVADVQRGGDDEQATEQRLWQLHDGILEVLRANLTLGAAPTVIQGIADYTVRQANVPKDGMWRSQVVIDIGVRGLINYS